MTDNSKILEFIDMCDDPEKLEVMICNAKEKGAFEVAEAAFRRRISLVPSERPGSIEHDFWQMINAFEHTLKEERGKTVRLSRTRQKVERVGVVQTLKDWALSNKETDGFRMLIDRGMPDLTGEAIVIRHPEIFGTTVVDVARARLIREGVLGNILPLSANAQNVG